MYTEIKTIEDALKACKTPIDLEAIKVSLAGLPAKYRSAEVKSIQDGKLAGNK